MTTPGNATKNIITQPNFENEYEYGTEIQFSCLDYQHYFDYSVPEDLVSYYYSTNINSITLSCNEYKYWTVQNGINGETCANKNSNSNELWCEDVFIPECVDRSILCTTPPIPKRAEMIISERPNIKTYEYKTEIHYKCQERYHFDYPVPNDFISFYYTENINEINVRCTEDKNWEVRGGIKG